MAVEREEWKFDTLCDLYDTLTITQVLGWLGLVANCPSLLAVLLTVLRHAACCSV